MASMAKSKPKRGDGTDVANATSAYEALASELDELKTKTKQLRARKREAAARLAEATKRATLRAITEILGPRMAARGFDLQGVVEVLNDIDETGLHRDAIRTRIRGVEEPAAAPVPVPAETPAADASPADPSSTAAPAPVDNEQERAA